MRIPAIQGRNRIIEIKEPIMTILASKFLSSRFLHWAKMTPLSVVYRRFLMRRRSEQYI